MDTASLEHEESSNEPDKEGDIMLQKIKNETAKEQGIPISDSESESDGNKRKKRTVRSQLQGNFKRSKARWTDSWQLAVGLTA